HADARSVGVLLARHLLLGRQDRLDRSQINVNHPRVRTLLDDSGDDVALATLELAENLVITDVAQALVDDLLRRERSDAAKVARLLNGLADQVAVVVKLLDKDGD